MIDLWVVSESMRILKFLRFLGEVAVPRKGVQELVPTDTILLEAIMMMAEQSGQLN